MWEMLEKLINFFVILVAIYFGDFPVCPSKKKYKHLDFLYGVPLPAITMVRIPLIGVINPVTHL